MNTEEEVEARLAECKREYALAPTAAVGWEIFQIEHMLLAGVQSTDTHRYSRQAIQHITSLAALEDQVNGFPRYIAATLHFTGRTPGLTDKVALAYYTDAVRKGPEVVRNLALRNIMIRHVLGLGCERDLSLVTSFLERYPGVRCPCPGRYEAIEILTRQPPTEALFACDEICRWLSAGATPQDVLERLISIDTGLTDWYHKALALIVILARAENWADMQNWSDCLQRFGMMLNGWDHDSVSRLTMWYGPFYNDLSASGLPIIGSTGSRNWGASDHENYGLSAGARRFVGLRAHDDGTVDFRFESDEEKPALILPEDLNVCLALVFGEHHTSWPSISVNSVELDSASLLTTRLSVYEPSWIRATAIGRTMYTTDVLCGELAWGLDEFEVEQAAESNIVDQWIDFTGTLKSVEGDKPSNGTGRLIRLEVADVSGSTTRNDNHWFVTVDGVTMRVIGGYNVSLNGSEVEWAYMESDYEHLRICRALTELYPTIANLIPAFDRIIQLSAMIYALDQARQLGFRPALSLVKQLCELRQDAELRAGTEGMMRTRQLPLTWNRGIGC